MELLDGAWSRRSIVNADGTTDTSSLVLWLQLESAMVDVRIPTEVADLRDRGGFEGCSLDDLMLLATCEASTGFTTCTPIEVGPDAVRRATAAWHTRGPDDVAIHPVTAYPEPGLLEWSDDGTVMTERAPSGAYVEEWHLVDESSRECSLVALPDGRRLYRTGPIGVLVRDRPTPLPRSARLGELIEEANGDRAMVAGMVDIEFSVVELEGETWRVTASTLPWRTGEVLDVDL